MDRLNALCQEIESKFGSFQNLESGEVLMKDNAFSDNKEPVKKSLQIHEMKYQKKGRVATKKVRGLRKNDFEKLKQWDLIESIMH